jgi:predicted permease
LDICFGSAPDPERIGIQSAVKGEKRMGSLLHDLRYGLRMLRKNIGFTTVVVITLALGIGANTAIFTLLNAVMLKSLPVKEPDRLVLFSDSSSEGSSLGDPPTEEWELFSYPVYQHLRNHGESFEDLAAFRSGEARLSVRLADALPGTPTQRAQGHLVSGNYFKVLGIDAAMGRTLTPEDDAPAAAPAAVISYYYWKERLQLDRAAVGKSITLNGTSFTIVGVTPPGFFGERVRRSPDFWLPLAFQPQIEQRASYLTRQDAYWLNLMGRLKPGATIEQAQAGVNVALRQFLTDQAGAQITEERRQGIRSSYLRLSPGGRGISGLRSFYSQPLRMLMVVVALILLIACANVGNLLLSRSAARQMEITLRVALGASRTRLIRQLLTESILLAIIGGALGLLFAGWGVSALVAILARTTPLDVSPDPLVLGFTAGISLLAGILFGLAPAVRATRTDLSSALKERAARAGGGRLRFGLAPALVISQVALSLVLLMGAGLFARSLLKLEREELGFERTNVMLVDIDPRLANYQPPQLSALYRQIFDRLNTLPGVRSATFASYSPMSGYGRSSNISLQGYPPKPKENMVVNDILIGPAYAQTLGLPLKAGREIGLQDTAASAKVAVVNESFVKHFFPDQNPIGRRFDFGDGPQAKGEIEIVGVIGDAKYREVKEKAKQTVYRPMLQIQDESAYLCNLEIRTVGDPLSIATEVRAAIGQIDSKLPIVGLTSLANQFDSSLRQERLVAQLAGFFGLLALILSCVGLYGVMAHAVARRTNEIGIRLALGAQRRDILWMVVRETLVLVGGGVALGVPTALAAAQLISSQLFELSALDPLTLVAASLLLAAVAVFAGYLPARRAARVDPMMALREY